MRRIPVRLLVVPGKEKGKVGNKSESRGVLLSTLFEPDGQCLQFALFAVTVQKNGFIVACGEQIFAKGGGGLGGEGAFAGKRGTTRYRLPPGAGGDGWLTAYCIVAKNRYNQRNRFNKQWTVMKLVIFFRHG